jgi:N-dimethylarginine dimethylaminohydrolase
MQVYVDSEVGQLREVLLGSIKTFSLEFLPLTLTQRYCYYVIGPPRPLVLREQQEAFIGILEHYGVKTHWVSPRLDSPSQVNTRDVVAVIGNSLIVCSMKEPLRQHEPEALEPLLAKLEGPPIRVDAGVIEGGDIFLDRETMYVGLSERTNPSGLGWLEARFSDRFEILAIRLQPLFLHLDLVFGLVGHGLALVYPPALQESSLETLRRRYKLIEVTKAEQFKLATNVLSISPDTVISDKRQARVNGILREQGLEVIELDYSEITKIGGAFRCSASPLVRDPL